MDKDTSEFSTQQALLSPIPESKRVKDDEDNFETESKDNSDVFDRLGGKGAKQFD
jgi:hypothetical protein